MLSAWGSVRGAMCLSPACASAGRLARWLSTEGSKSEEDGKGDGAGKEEAQGLSAAQMAKALLAGNVRAQLTTIVPNPSPEQPADVTSTVVHYLAPRGASPVVLLNQQHHSQHFTNLAEHAQASLCTGHINPTALVQRIRAAGWLPHRVNLVGGLERLPPAEVKFVWEQAQEQYKGVSLRDMLPSQEQLGSMIGFRIAEAKRCQFVDATGSQHEVPPLEVDAAFLDPLAVGQHDLLLEFLDSPDRRTQLRAFCAAYLGVEVGEALVSEADRLGFTVLGRPVAGAADGSEPKQEQQQQQQQQRWRQFRFGFQRELRNTEAFWKMVDEMWIEVERAAGEQQ